MAENRDEHNRSGLILFVFSMAFVFLFFVYIVAVHPGIDLGEDVRDPVVAGAGEVAVDVSKVTEPWVSNPDMLAHGKKMFMLNCQTCHGPEGHGDGPAGAALNPKPRNLVKGPWKKGGGYIGWFTVVTEGLPGTSMAPFGHLNAIDRWALVQFIDSITEAKVKEDAAKVADFAKAAK